MPIIKSAQKAMRVSARKRVFNLRQTRAMKASVKETRLLLKEGKKTEATLLLPKAFKAIDKAAKRGTIKKNAAARKKSRLAKMFSDKTM